MKGARPFVVHDPIETTRCFAGSKEPWLTPITMVRSSPLAGAEMMTFFAPPLVMWSSAIARSVKRPVDSTTISAPTLAHWMAPGSFSENTTTFLPSTSRFPSTARTSPLKLPRIESCFRRWARVGASVMSFTATISMSFRPYAARNMLRPMRPNPLIPTFTILSSSKNCRYAGAAIARPGFRDRRFRGPRGPVRPLSS